MYIHSLTQLLYSSYVPTWARYLLWPMYWYGQGALMTGVWVLAHECGHESFSDSDYVNNTVGTSTLLYIHSLILIYLFTYMLGTICHSLLLVPYHSWRITHRRHHGNTGSCADDEVFAPATRSDWANEMLRETPLANVWGIIVMLTVGWMPGYLVFNATGPAKYRGKNANHFSPSAEFFENKERHLIVQTDIAFLSVVALLAHCIYTYSFQTGIFAYLFIYLFTHLLTHLLTSISCLLLLNPMGNYQLSLSVDHLLTTH